MNEYEALLADMAWMFPAGVDHSADPDYQHTLANLGRLMWECDTNA